ncbi:M64 family metallopeptidase [Verrucomicrobiales bacterium]|nr:M64 family metallopeptidase [Verrucomicrobiales bacterium]
MNKVLHMLAVAFAVLTAPFGFAQDLISISETGPRGQRVNFVIVAEGYTSSQLSDFERDARAVFESMFSEEPFLRYQPLFNLYALPVASAESGADEPDVEPPVEVDTAFDATYNAYGIGRLLVIHYSKVREAVMEEVPEYDIVLVLVNSPRFGGSGGQFATASIAPASINIAAHEIGHSFGGLTDEYSDPDGSPKEAPNATAETSRDHIKWRLWFADDTPIPTVDAGQYQNAVGLFEGAVYREKDWYRPHRRSKMRTLGRPWGQVNSEHLIKRIYRDISPFFGTDPGYSSLNFTGKGDVVITLENLKEPGGEPLPVEWRIGDEIVEDQVGATFTRTLHDFGVGQFEVTATVIDNTDMVRSDPTQRLQSVASWTVDVSNLDLIFTDWLAAAFPEGADPGGVTGDPDADGWQNVIEYALAADPAEADSREKFALTNSGEGMVLDFVIDPRRTDAMLVIESSDDLVVWEEIARSDNGGAFSGSVIVEESVLDDGKVRCRMGLDGDVRFVRASAEILVEIE